MITWNRLEGELLGDRYRLDRLIGVGGFGAVFEAHDVELADRVAVKVVDPQFSKQVRREAVLGRRFKHKNMVRVENICVDNAPPFIVMEFLDGQTLDRLPALSTAQFLTFVREVCSALQQAHEQQLVHRDLKPQNIMLVNGDGAEQPRFVILDFGISAQLGEGDTLRGGTLDGVGTPTYMSPEQFRGEEPTPQSDIYSFGVILYRLLTGTQPFPFDRTSIVDYWRAVQENEPSGFSEVDGDCEATPEVEALVLRCLAKAAEDRPSSMQDIADELEVAHQSHPSVFRNLHSIRGSERPRVPAPESEPKTDRDTGNSAATSESARPATLAPPWSAEVTEREPPPDADAENVDEFEREPTSRSPWDLAQSNSGRPGMPSWQHRSFPTRRLAFAITTLLVLLAIAIYPYAQGRRAVARIDGHLKQYEFRLAARTLASLSAIERLWVNAADQRQRIRETARTHVEHLIDDQDFAVAVGELRELDESVIASGERDKLFDGIAEQIVETVRSAAEDGDYRGAVAFANKDSVVGISKEQPFEFHLPNLKNEILRIGLSEVDRLAKLDRHASALREAESLAKAIPGHEPLDDRILVEAKFVDIEKALETAADQLKKKRFSEAIEQLKNALTLQPDPETTLAVRLGLGEAYRSWAMHGHETREDCKSVASHFELALQEIESVLQSDPGNQQAESIKFGTYSDCGMFHLDCGTQHAERSKDDPTSQAAIDAVCHFRAARKYLALSASGKDKSQAAAKQLERIADTTSDQGRIRFTEAINHKNAGRILSSKTAAIKSTDEAARLQSEQAVQAEMDRADEQFQSAIDHLDIAILADETRLANYYFRGFARSELKRPDYAGAISDFERFRQFIEDQKSADGSLDDEFVFLKTQGLANALSRLAWIKATCPDKSLRSGRQAVTHAKAALKIIEPLYEKSPDAPVPRLDFSNARKALAAAFAEQGSFETAIRLSKQTIAELGRESPEWIPHDKFVKDYYEKQTPFHDRPGRNSERKPRRQVGCPVGSIIGPSNDK